MDAGLLDVLHHAGDVDGLAVGDAVHVDLDRVVQVAVDQHRVVAGDPHRLAHVTVQTVPVVDDLHRAAAQHVARADHHRIADALGDRLGFLGRPRDAVFRLPQAEPVQAAAGSARDPRRCRSHRREVPRIGMPRLRAAPATASAASGPPYCTMQPSTVPFCCSRRTSAITSSAVSGSKYSRSEVS